MRDPLETGEWREVAATASHQWPGLDGYELLEELGRGGMGVVYRAREVASSRPVALKLIRDASLASSADRARFRVEAEAASLVRHPHVVELYEVGERNGQPFLAMELVEGGNLARFLRGRAVPSADAAEFVLALARAIHVAHEQRIIHRDLKPANILLSKASADRVAGSPDAAFARGTFSGWQPKISDFGLAKRLDGESTAFTQVGEVLGSASYMAPEQAAGRNQDVGVAADVYAVGAILYELLTGAPPFRGETWQQTVQQVLHDEPLPPCVLTPTVAKELETICLHCLEKDPIHRYASAELLANDLESFLKNKPIAASPVDPRERLARSAARDGYALLREIGRGPRSVVHQATYEPLRQPVVVKVLNRELFTPQSWTQHIQRHTERWSTVAHPQLVAIQRAGLWDGAPYMVMEYVQHGDLSTRLREQHYTVEQSLQLIAQLAEIVGYLHRQGVVHGNLKPTNVLFAADGIPRLADIRETSGLFPDGTTWLECEAADLAYLAPEVVQDCRVETRPPTDVYGLGLLLYELLARRPAFAADNADGMLAQIQDQEPAPPSMWNPQTPPELDAICLRCLRKTPWRRYLRAFDLARRLRNLGR